MIASVRSKHFLCARINNYEKMKGHSQVYASFQNLFSSATSIPMNAGFTSRTACTCSVEMSSISEHMIHQTHELAKNHIQFGFSLEKISTVSSIALQALTIPSLLLISFSSQKSEMFELRDELTIAPPYYINIETP